MYSGGVWFNGPRFLYLQCLQFLVSGFFGPFAIKNSNDFCLASLQVGSQLLGNHSTARDGRTAGRDEAHLGGGLHVFEEQLDELSTLFLCASVQRQTSETSSPAVCPLIALVPHFCVDLPKIYIFCEYKTMFYLQIMRLHRKQCLEIY